MRQEKLNVEVNGMLDQSAIRLNQRASIRCICRSKLV